jgi:hypothetical protein
MDRFSPARTLRSHPLSLSAFLVEQIEISANLGTVNFPLATLDLVIEECRTTGLVIGDYQLHGQVGRTLDPAGTILQYGTTLLPVRREKLLFLELKLFPDIGSRYNVSGYNTISSNFHDLTHIRISSSPSVSTVRTTGT